ncbi:Hypothetical predicted protein [Olea europaea subsp. europaea]|uniref:Uncharacterized protein n=1 Tax=Olea europaea subsp. europaea TaxID=158383 RepID=A0A8S0V7Z6_OLEEU|nr:Hypothetical predicted protein [Olea europaea subsp. europaea]
MEGSEISEYDGKWLHELALNNKVLENFNLLSNLGVKSGDLELIAKNCASLVKVKICTDTDIADLVGFFCNAAALEEFWGGFFDIPQEDGVGDQNALERYAVVAFPQRLCSLGIMLLENQELPIVFHFAARLKKLDLHSVLLDTEGHCQLLERCPNLEMLKGRDMIGDRGLGVVAQNFKKLKRLWLCGDENYNLEAMTTMITHRGLILLSQGFLELEYLVFTAYDITNASLESVGTHLKKLYRFHMTLLENKETTTNFPLDNGV